MLYLRGPSHPIRVTKGVNYHPVNSVGRVQSAEPEVAGSDRQSHFFKKNFRKIMVADVIHRLSV